MSDVLSYSFHLGRNKNKSKSAKEIAKTMPTGETSFADNAIHNLKDLSDVNNHNHRAYDNKIEDIEIIIELGDMEFWRPQEMTSRKQMTKVFAGQVEKLSELVPEFKIANAVAHYDETSPHLHIVGVPIKEGFKTGMKRQVCKSKVFTKESLTKLQDDMRNDCIKRYNEVFKETAKLKPKEKGRNFDLDVKDMKDYQNFKRNQEKNYRKLDNANKECEKLEDKTNEVKEILVKLKPTAFNKNNRQISNDDVNNIIEYATEVSKTIKGVKSLNRLKGTMEDFERSYQNLRNENFDLKLENKNKDDEIENLKDKVERKDKTISNLENLVERLRSELDRFKGFWRKIIRRFQDQIFDERVDNVDTDKRSFTIVAEDLEKNGIFDNNDSEIIHDASRKVLTEEERNKIKGNKNKNRKMI